MKTITILLAIIVFLIVGLTWWNFSYPGSALFLRTGNVPVELRATPQPASCEEACTASCSEFSGEEETQCLRDCSEFCQEYY